MAKFHINPVTGSAGQCSAQKAGCPFGGEGEHFDSVDQAMANYETVMAGMTLPEPTSREVAKESAIVAFESRVITDSETNFSLEDPDDPLGMPAAEGTAQNLALDLPPGDYKVYYDDYATGEREEATLTIDGDGGALAVRVPDPAAEAADMVSRAVLVESVRQAENLDGENVASTPIPEAWLLDGSDEHEEVTTAKAWLVASATTRSIEGKLSSLAKAAEEAEFGSMDQLEALEAYDSAVGTLETRRGEEVRAQDVWTASVATKQKAAVSVSDTLSMYGSMAEDDGNADAAENLRAYASEVLAYARFAEWSSPEFVGHVAKGLRDLQDGLEQTERTSDSWAPGHEYYTQASGAFEPLLDGFADLTD